MLPKKNVVTLGFSGLFLVIVQLWQYEIEKAAAAFYIYIVGKKESKAQWRKRL